MSTLYVYSAKHWTNVRAYPFSWCADMNWILMLKQKKNFIPENQIQKKHYKNFRTKQEKKQQQHKNEKWIWLECQLETNPNENEIQNEYVTSWHLQNNVCERYKCALLIVRCKTDASLAMLHIIINNNNKNSASQPIIEKCLIFNIRHIRGSQ